MAVGVMRISIGTDAGTQAPLICIQIGVRIGVGEHTTIFLAPRVRAT